MCSHPRTYGSQRAHPCVALHKLGSDGRHALPLRAMGEGREEPSTNLHKPYAPSSPAIGFRVVVEEGPDAGRALTVDGSAPGRMLVGVSHVCDLELSDPTVSRRHCALDLDGGWLRITDLDSTNGVTVDRLCVLAARLGGGEAVRLGATTLRIERQIAAPPEITSETSFGKVIGASSEMRRLYKLCRLLADSDLPVIIEGETGTGKELLAESLHELGSRAGGPFVVFDCTIVPGSLMESELFGHERGAFTGAVAAQKGMLERAHRGTLLIDEIGDLALPLQAKLLRAIGRREVYPLGGAEPRSVDVRILAATRRDIDQEVQAGRFRDDLFHRLAVGRIELPPLRARRGDVGLLARRFANELGTPGLLTDEILAKWDNWHWPGNVRELRNAVERFLTLGELSTLRRPTQDDSLSAARNHELVDRVLELGLALPEARSLMVLEFSRRYIQDALNHHGGNVTRTAKASGVTRRYIQKLRAKLGEGG